MIQAVVFDLDGVLLDSEPIWDEARRQVARQHGGRWREGATADMMGMSSREWSAYLHDELGVALGEERIVELVVGVVLERYRAGLPFLPGAREAVRRAAGRWPAGLASSANRVVIEEVLELSGLGSAFAATVSSEEVAAGKPHPDVYLEAARRLGKSPGACVAIEDSGNGIRSAAAAGLRVVAVPNKAFPPAPELLGQADLVLDDLSVLTVGALEKLGAGSGPAPGADMVDEQELESFPASDPHSDWAGPST
jgi:HAD superfamily hydrolase (TIGR01509 family)